jgi:hypothetical protein
MLSHNETVAAVVARTNQEQHFQAVHSMLRQKMSFEDVGSAFARILH